MGEAMIIIYSFTVPFFIKKVFEIARLFSKNMQIQKTELQGKIDRSVYNKRKRRIFGYIEKIRETLSNKFSDFTNVFIVDSTHIEICKISRANRSAICSTEDIKPFFGYCASQKTRYFGFKLHAVCDKN